MAPITRKRKVQTNNNSIRDAEIPENTIHNANEESDHDEAELEEISMEETGAQGMMIK